MTNTILFIHGMFQNSKSRDKWIEYFTEKGYYCIAPAWPLHEGEPTELRKNSPADLGDLRLATIISEMESIVSAQ